MSGQHVVLGDGVFAIGAVDVGLTRGGGQFTVEREYKEIEADGDYGPVKGRIRKIRSRAKLVMNAMELIPANIPLLYPAMTKTTTGGVDTITAADDIAETDYNDTVTWTGKTAGGRPVVITLENAINLENIDWTLPDKDEVVPAVTYTATYLDDARTTEPWEIEFLEAVVMSTGLTALVVQDDAPGAVTLSPVFDNGVYSYIGSIVTARAGVTITPTAAGHTIKVAGQTVASAGTSSLIAIAAGELKTIEIVAQQANALPIKYEINIFRAAS